MEQRRDPLEDSETEAAAAEAAAIGGVAGDEDLDPADRPVLEGGGGEAEGFEQAEDALVENASHGDQHSGRMALYQQGAPEEAGADPAAYGEGDDVHSSELADPEPTTQELQLAALRREESERAAAGGADDPAAEHAHERRADKTAYLREKLAERAESEREDT